MKKKFSTVISVLIEGQYDTDITTEKDAINASVEMVLAEARSNALYNGEQDGVNTLTVELQD